MVPLEWVEGHYVAASTLVYGPTLDYVLRKLAAGAPQREDLQEAADRLIQYFKRGKVDLS